MSVRQGNMQLEVPQYTSTDCELWLLVVMHATGQRQCGTMSAHMYVPQAGMRFSSSKCTLQNQESSRWTLKTVLFAEPALRYTQAQTSHLHGIKHWKPKVSGTALLWSNSSHHLSPVVDGLHNSIHEHERPSYPTLIHPHTDCRRRLYTEQTLVLSKLVSQAGRERTCCEWNVPFLPVNP